MSSPVMVPMISPDGKSGSIPMDRVHDAEAAGFKQAVVMTSPDGQMGFVPHDRAADAIKAGFKVGQPSAQEGYKAAGDTKPGYVQSLGQSMGAPTTPQEAGGILTGKSGAMEGAADSPYNPPGGVNLPGGLNPGNVAKNVATNVGESIAHGIKGGVQQLKDAVQNVKEGGPVVANAGKAVSGYGDVISAVNPVVAAGGKGGQQVAAGDLKGAAGTFTGGMLQGAAMVGGMESPTSIAPENPIKGALAGRMAETPTGSQFTRGDVLAAAAKNGVKLDIAQATEHPVAIQAKRANQFSLVSQHQYAARQSANKIALENWADKESSTYAPESKPPDVLGSQMQDALKQDAQNVKAAASQKFAELDESVGSKAIDPAPVQKAAQQIIKDYAGYYLRHPELLPKQAWRIMEDLAAPPGAQAGAGSARQLGPKAFSWDELHQLRSDLQDYYRNNPDIAKGKSQAWLQQMVSTIDKSMNDASAGLSPEDRVRFRDANALWADFKNTYDNPQSPLFQAVRTQSPSQIPNMLAKSSPEVAATTRGRLGSLAGDFQRNYVEGLVNFKDGMTPDFKNMHTRLSRVPQIQLETMLGPDGAKNLRLMGEVARKVMLDDNPSGTARVGVPAAEVTGLFTHPVATVPELGAQYVGAKAMHSPKVLNYLTSPATEAMMARGGWVRDPATGRIVRRKP